MLCLHFEIQVSRVYVFRLHFIRCNGLNAAYTRSLYADFLSMLSKFFFLRMLSNFLLLRFVMVWLQPYFSNQRVSVSDLFRMLIVAHTSMLYIWSLYMCSYFHAIATLCGISQVVVHFLVHFDDRFELLLCVLVNLFSSRICLFKQFYVRNVIITWYW